MNSSAPAAPTADAALMHSIIKRIATGPELSKDISADEARAGMRLILDGQVDPVQAAIFFIALRMKRETDDENRGVLDALRDATETVVAAVDDVLDLADPYDGYTRSLSPSPFLPAVLAACGVPTLAHGIESVGPKFGVTHHQVLRAAGLAVNLSPAQAAKRLGEKGVGWAYVDQQAFCPKLYQLEGLRTLIVKRPVLTTVETCIGPIRARGRTHLMTGYVHKPYSRVYAMLARHAGFDSALLIRGVEGGVIPSLRQAGKFFYYHERGEEQMREITPADFGIDQPILPVPLPGAAETKSEEGDGVAATLDTALMARATVELGLETLAGKPSPMRDALVAAAAVALTHMKRHASLRAAADAVRAVLDNGQAAAHFKR